MNRWPRRVAFVCIALGALGTTAVVVAVARAFNDIALQGNSTPAIVASGFGFFSLPVLLLGPLLLAVGLLLAAGVGIASTGKG